MNDKEGIKTSRQLEKTIGTRVKLARAKTNLTQEQLAEKIEKSVETVSNIERGLVLPTIETLLQIASVLKTTVAELINEENQTHKTTRRVELEAKLQSIAGSMNDDKLDVLVRVGGVL
jgi:transcriptional regulator with XRE-family HTH domain